MLPTPHSDDTSATIRFVFAAYAASVDRVPTPNSDSPSVTNFKI
jgi:hypothetical protein